MREERRVIIPPDDKPRYGWVTNYTCDGCGKKLTRTWPDSEENSNFAHELAVYLDSEQCVNFRRQRDYCPACLLPVWEAINKLLKADPDDERDREYD